MVVLAFDLSCCGGDGALLRNIDLNEVNIAESGLLELPDSESLDNRRSSPVTSVDYFVTVMATESWLSSFSTCTSESKLNTKSMELSGTASREVPSFVWN